MFLNQTPNQAYTQSSLPQPPTSKKWLLLGTLVVCILFVFVGRNIVITQKKLKFPTVGEFRENGLNKNVFLKPTPYSAPVHPPTSVSTKPPQFVILTFDGSRSLAMWQQTVEFAQRLIDQGKPLHFTYFISGVYWLPGTHTGEYLPPQRRAGSSAIGYADSWADVSQRTLAANNAIAHGHELGSHANGHFAGGMWSVEQWRSELTQFRNFTLDWQKHTDISISLAAQLQVPGGQFAGFRAPLLSRNENLYFALKDLGYTYDSSGVAASPSAWPVKRPNGIWTIPMAGIPLAGTKNVTIAMDYNFFLADTNARELAKRGTPRWQFIKERTLQSLRNYFELNYQGNRAPVLYGNHFSLFNDGAYWAAMQDFASEVCGLPEVRCVTMGELVQYLQVSQLKP